MNNLMKVDTQVDRIPTNLSNTDIPFLHNDEFYQIVSINDYNISKLDTCINNNLPIHSINMDPEGVDSYYCVIRSGITPEFPNHIDIICIVEKL